MRFFWEIVPATSCNFRCLNCYAAENARPDKRILSWQEMKMALDRAIGIGMEKIDLLGGEPFTYPQLERFIGYFKRKIRAKNSFCGIVSNGSLITEFRAQNLFNAGLDQLSISLDGTTAEVNDLNRGRGSFNQALKGIENTLKANIPLTIAYTITPFNLLKSSNLFWFAKKIGAKAVSVQITEMAGRARKTFGGIRGFNRFVGLKAICGLYFSKPPLYTEVSSRSLFKEFLNQFFNAGLLIEEAKCGGGGETFMISSGGDLFPCSEYAYFPNGRQRRKGVNLVHDSLKTIEKAIRGYRVFNQKMKNLAKEKFLTCKRCPYNKSCIPCPLLNPAGEIPECHWVRSQAKLLRKRVLDSKLKLLIKPTKSSFQKIEFPVTTQKQPICVSMDKDEFMKFVALGKVSKIIQRYSEGKENVQKIVDEGIIFLCKLRSHRIIEIEAFKDFYFL